LLFNRNYLTLSYLVDHVVKGGYGTVERRSLSLSELLQKMQQLTCIIKYEVPRIPRQLKYPEFPECSNYPEFPNNSTIKNYLKVHFI